MKLSVLLAVYNGEKYLKECINSILNQSYENWELIIVNDGSTDGTQQIIEEFADERIHKLIQPNRGLAFSLNRAAEEAQGEILVRQDADDISEPNRIAVIAETFTHSDDYVMVASNATIVDEDGEKLYERQIVKTKVEAIDKILTLENPFVHGSLAFKASTFKECKGYDVSYPTSQDFDFIIRLISLGELSVISESLYKLRLHSESVTSRKSWRQIIYLNRFISTIKEFLVLEVSFKTKCTFFLSRIIIFIYFSRINCRSMYFYQIGSILDQTGRDSESSYFYTLAINYSRYNIPAFIKKYSFYNLNKK